MKYIFLIPPSEGKNKGIYNPIVGEDKKKEQLSFVFEKPIDIAVGVTEKDLKCQGNRYVEGLEYNKALVANRSSDYMSAIARYSGVMFKAINYHGMSTLGKQFFENNFLILSGMYGMLKPMDIIANYKLPIESKGLYGFWGDRISEQIKSLQVDFIVNLLPQSYLKMIDIKNLHATIINIYFLTEKNGKIVRMTHGVKKIKGEWIQRICEGENGDYNDFGGEVFIARQEKRIDIHIMS